MKRRIALPLMLLLLAVSFSLVAANAERSAPEKELPPAEGVPIELLPSEGFSDSLSLRTEEFAVFLYLNGSAPEEVYYSLILMRDGTDSVVDSGYEWKGTEFQLEAFHDLMGYSGFSVKRTENPSSVFTEYYAVTEERVFRIGENFGLTVDEVWSVDFDGDSRQELICNATYMADGAARVYAFRQRGSKIERGCPNGETYLSEQEKMAGAMQIAETYDPKQNVVVTTIYSGEKEPTVHELQGFTHFCWEPYADAMDPERVYYDVLTGKTDFFAAEFRRSMNISQVRELVTSSDISVKPESFTVLDLDDDSINEALIHLAVGENGTSGGYLILHYDGEEVYGYHKVYRGLLELKTDGTYISSGGAADWGIGKILLFLPSGFQQNYFTYCESSYDKELNLHVRYVVSRWEATREEFEAVRDRQEAKEDVIWYPFTEEVLFERLCSSGELSARFQTTP